jgi:murein DD-endopeptidase MepM/ murein hydrolase activator NlpD
MSRSSFRTSEGYDLRAGRNQPCYAAREGTVLDCGTDNAEGLYVILLHGPYDGKFYKTRYWHLLSIEVERGEWVWTGQLVGYCDNTGYSAGDHLHFDIKETDRLGNTLNHDNGYLGAINPDPVMIHKPAYSVNLIRLGIETVRAGLQRLNDSIGRIPT